MFPQNKVRFPLVTCRANQSLETLVSSRFSHQHMNTTVLLLKRWNIDHSLELHLASTVSGSLNPTSITGVNLRRRQPTAKYEHARLAQKTNKLVEYVPTHILGRPHLSVLYLPARLPAYIYSFALLFFWHLWHSASGNRYRPENGVCVTVRTTI